MGELETPPADETAGQRDEGVVEFGSKCVRIGAGIGVAVLTSLMAAAGSGIDGYRIAFLAGGCFSLLDAAPAHFGLRARARVGEAPASA